MIFILFEKHSIYITFGTFPLNEHYFATNANVDAKNLLKLKRLHLQILQKVCAYAKLGRREKNRNPSDIF